ncbi:hypothetical protein T484DRAFT_1756122 [Baffinella frigidus]|nr:hypothetical protein T484DRAFT_1756122 [Cryptophyta sp. CCMP2293]
MAPTEESGYDRQYPRLATKARQLVLETRAAQVMLSNQEIWKGFQKFAKFHEGLRETVEEHEHHPNLPVVNGTTLLTDAATHVNVVTMVAKCVKQYDCKNFEASSKLFDGWGKAIIDVPALEKNLHLSWRGDPLSTRKLIFYMGNMKQQRWIFRFSMMWMYKNHRKEFNDNIHAIPSLMSLQELPEILSYCLNPVESKLFGIGTAYRKHLLSKQTHAFDARGLCPYDPLMPARQPTEFKDGNWKKAQRQAFADSKGIPLDDIYELHYDSDQRRLMTLIADVNYLYKMVRQFQYTPACGDLDRLIRVDPMPFFEKFLDSDGSYTPVNYLDLIPTNDTATASIIKKRSHVLKNLKEDEEMGSDDDDDDDVSTEDGFPSRYYCCYFEIPDSFLRKDRTIISTLDRCTFLESIKEKVTSVLTDTFNNVSENLLSMKSDSGFKPQKDMKLSHYDRPEYFKELETKYHPPYVGPPLTKKGPPCWYEGRFEDVDAIQDIIKEQDEHTYAWFKAYGGEFMFLNPEDVETPETHETLQEQVDWYENACIQFFYPRTYEKEWTPEDDERVREYEVMDYYRSTPWTKYDVRSLRDVGDITKKANQQNKLLKRKGFVNDTVKGEYKEYLKGVQAEKSIKTKETRREEQAKHEKFNFSDFRKNAFFREVVELFVKGLLFELDQVKRIESGEEGVQLHGMYAKWAPSPNHHHDKATGIASAISDRLAVELSWGSNARNAGSLYNYAHMVLSPIRKAAKIAESFLGHKQPKWSEIDYAKLSAWAMQHGWQKLLLKNDPKGLEEYLESAPAQLSATKIRPEDVMQAQINAMECLGAVIAADHVTHWIRERFVGNKVVDETMKYLTFYRSYDGMQYMGDPTNMGIVKRLKKEAQMKLSVAVKQWKSMLLDTLKAFQKIKKSQDPHRECVVTILDHVSTWSGYDITGKTTAILLATSTRVKGSPWHNDNGSDIVCSYGSTASYQTVSAKPNAVRGGEALFTVDAEKQYDSMKAGRFGHSRQANVYQSVDLVTQRAIEHNITAKEFATWTLVFISDREFDEPESLKSRWHIDHTLPYKKMRNQIDAAGFGGAAGYPKFIFYRENSDENEKNTSGIPVESDTVPGVVLMSGDSNSSIADILEMCFAKGVTSTKTAMQRALGRRRFDQVRSRVTLYRNCLEM